MTNRSWLKKTSDDFNKGMRASQLDITCSSEEENTPKRLKLDPEASCSTYYVPRNEHIDSDQESLTIGNVENSLSTFNNSRSSDEESVVVGNPELSPVLTESQLEPAPYLSPILGKAGKGKRKKQKSKVTLLKTNVSDIFARNLFVTSDIDTNLKSMLVTKELYNIDEIKTQNINNHLANINSSDDIENESCTNSLENIITNLIEYSQESNKQSCDENSQEKYSIDYVKTQPITELCDNTCDNDVSLNINQVCSLNQSQETKCVSFTTNEATTTSIVPSCSSKNKKKRYKKGGFASQLQTAMKTQQNQLSIWKHEVHLSVTNNTQIITPFEESAKQSLCIIDIEREYGNLLLVCECSKKEKCVVIVNSDTHYKFTIGVEFDLYPPYLQRTILYKTNLVKCFLNVVKILFLQNNLNL